MKGGTMLRRIAAHLWLTMLLTAVFVSAVLLTPLAACAQGAPAADKTAAAPRITALRPGFAGRFKVGYWAPFAVELTGGSEAVQGRVELLVPDSDGVPTRVRAPAEGTLSLAPGERKNVLVYAKLGQLTGDVTVSFVDDTATLATRRFAAGEEGPLAGVMPSSATLTLSLGAMRPKQLDKPAARGPAMTELASILDLPPDWWGLEGVDTILLSTSSADIAEQLSGSPAQLAALELWVQMGGQLVLSVGERGAELLAAGAPLARFAPGEFQSVVPLRQSTVLETYAESSEPLSPGEPLKLEVTQLREARGRVEAFAGSGPRDLPLVVRTPRGFGQIVFVAFDLDRPPLDTWVARPQLIERILGRSSARMADETSGMLGAVTTLGFVDLSGQLRGALDQFPGVRLVPFWLVAVLATAYLLCIGPLDYYLVKHVLKRPAATWLTFSLIVSFFAVGAVLMAYGLKGNSIRLNQLDLVDFDAETGFVRGTTWSNLFSPEIATYDLSLVPAPAHRTAEDSAHDATSGVLFSWFGLSGTGFGGMDSSGGATGGMGAASRNLPLFSLPYDYSARLDRIRRVPIAVWSSKAFIGRWWGQATGGVEANLADDGRLVGTIKNHLDVPLSGAVLIYDRWAYVIRDFAPGRQIDLAFDVDPQTVDTYLRHVTAQGDRQISAPYDQATFDVPRIVEMMTAQELAEGNYTGLANQYQRYVELSDLVHGGRAVLIGRVAAPGSSLERDDKPLGAETQNWTFHRYVFPVAEQASP